MTDIRVLVNGAKGKMGRQTCLAVNEAEGLTLVGQTDIDDNLGAAIRDSQAQVVVDFTHPSCARKNAETILDAGARGVIGTTGFEQADLEALAAKAAGLSRGTIIAPNFAIGVLLMIRFAEEAVKHFPAVEVIELHHDRKADAPSGTAVSTADRLARARASAPPPRPPENETVAGARGGTRGGIRVHSIRLPGFLAHQEVIFGGPGQVLTIRHDTTDRSAFMPGVVFAVRKVMELDRLVFGLDELL